MKYVRMPIEIEAPEQMGYGTVRYNLTESSVSDLTLGELKPDLSKLLLAYGHHQGDPLLRAEIALQYGLSTHDILTTVGASTALFLVATALLNAGDHLLVMHPNYATNIETPRAIGCEIDFIELKFENGFRPMFDEIKKKIRKNTKIISITTPHNPTGMCLTFDELTQFVQLAEENDAWLVVDETYRELAFGEPLPFAATLSPRAISISSVSKAFGLPGLRLGWIACTDQTLQELFLAAKEQVFICNSVLDETVALYFLERKDSFFNAISGRNRKHFELVQKFMRAENRLEWIEPKGGVVCFPRIKNKIDTEKFYQVLNHDHQTFVGPGHWFESNKNFFRIGYGWPTTADLETGLENISKTLDLF